MTIRACDKIYLLGIVERKRHYGIQLRNTAYKQTEEGFFVTACIDKLFIFPFLCSGLRDIRICQRFGNNDIVIRGCIMCVFDRTDGVCFGKKEG